MSCSRTCRSIIAICSGGMRLAARRRLRFEADDLVVQLAAGDLHALAFGDNGVSEQVGGLEAGLAAAAALVAAGWSGAAPHTGSAAARSSRTSDLIILFIDYTFVSLLMLII